MKDLQSDTLIQLMSLLQFFKRGENVQADSSVAAPPESVEVIRQRAKHRLIGAAVLVLVGVLGFPLLFDTQPRPVSVDIAIEIPNKNAVKPLTLPASPVQAAQPAVMPAPSVAQAVPVAIQTVPAAASLSPQEEVVAASPVAPVLPASQPAVKVAVAPASQAKAVPKPEQPAKVEKTDKPSAKPEPKAEPKPKPAAAVVVKVPPKSMDDGARAAALLAGKPLPAASPPASSPSVRLVVQVGAFAEVSAARQARLTLEKAGFKTYTQVVQTKEGKRIRVRAGPFASKAEADKAAGKIKALGLSAAVLTL